MSVAPYAAEEASKPRRSSLLGSVFSGSNAQPPKAALTFLSIPLSAFPVEARPLLSKFDGDGNGNIGIKELQVAAELYEASQKKVARLGRLLAFGSILLAVVLASMAGLTYVVVDRLKDSSVSTDGFMMTKDGDNTLTVSSIQITHQRQISSYDSEDTLRALKYIETYSVDTTTNGAWSSVALPVLGYTRRVYSPNNDGRMASIVTFLVPNGAVILNGTDMAVEVDGAIGLQSTYVQTLASVFPVAMHTGTGRRLQALGPAPNAKDIMLMGQLAKMQQSPDSLKAAGTPPPSIDPSGGPTVRPSAVPTSAGGPVRPPSGVPLSPCGGAPVGTQVGGRCSGAAVPYGPSINSYLRCA